MKRVRRFLAVILLIGVIMGGSVLASTSTSYFEIIAPRKGAWSALKYPRHKDTTSSGRVNFQQATQGRRCVFRMNSVSSGTGASTGWLSVGKSASMGSGKMGYNLTAYLQTRAHTEASGLSRTTVRGTWYPN